MSDDEIERRKNLNEIINGTISFIKNNNITISQLMKDIPGPDFPTGGTIIGKDIIKQGYKTGRGSFKIRGEISVENLKNGKDRLAVSYTHLTLPTTDQV